jgi:hypothetical protein
VLARGVLFPVRSEEKRYYTQYPFDLRGLILGKTRTLQQPVEGASETAVELGSPAFEASAAGATWVLPRSQPSYPALVLVDPSRGGYLPELFVQFICTVDSGAMSRKSGQTSCQGEDKLPA